MATPSFDKRNPFAKMADVAGAYMGYPFIFKSQVDFMNDRLSRLNPDKQATVFPGLHGEDLEPTVELPKSTRPKQQTAPTFHQMPDRPEEQEAPTGGLASLGISPETVQQHTERVHSVKQQETEVPSGLSSLGISPETVQQYTQHKVTPTGEAQPGLLRQGLDVLGGIGEVPLNVIGGGLGWAFGIGGYYGAQFKQRAGEALGVYDKMTPAEKDALGEAVREDFGSLFGVLGARTKTGETLLTPLNWTMEKLSGAAEDYLTDPFIDKEKYPTLHRTLYFITEGALTAGVFHYGFKGAGKGVKKTKETKIYKTLNDKMKRFQEAKAKKQQERADSIAKGAEAYIKKNAPDIVEVFNPERQAAVKNDFDVRRQAIKDADLPVKEKKKQLNKLDNEWQKTNEQMLESMAKAKEAQARAAEQSGTRDRIAEAAARRQQQMAGTEGMSAFDIPRRPEPPGATASELSQRSKGFEAGTVRRPTFEPEPRRRAERPVETQRLGGTPVLQTGETIPRSSYQVGPDGKVQKVSEVGARKTYQIDEFGKPHLVENIPGERQVWQITPKEAGGTTSSSTLYSGLDISRIFESIKPNRLKGVAKSMSAEQLETVRTLGMQAEKAGEPLFDHLKKNGMPTDQARKMSKVYDAVRNDRPWFGGQIFSKFPEGVRDPTRLTDNERNVNTSRKSNPQVPVGEEILYQAMSAKKPAGRLGRLGKAFTPTPWMLEKFGDAPFIKDLWHKSHAIERAVGEANQAVFAKAKELQKTYPDRKLREEAYIKMMSQEKLGRKSLVDDGMRPIDGPIQYEGLVLELNQVFKDFFDQVNHTRESLGLKPIRQVQHYLPMVAREHFLDRARKIFDGEGGAKDGTPNLVLDSPEMIQHRHTPSAMQATKFAHKKRWLLKEGVHLETDPIKLMTRYGQTANKHIHYSPLNAFVHELTTNYLHDPIRNRQWRMKDHNYPMHEFLTRWSNKLAGRPNVILPDAMKFVETGARTLNQNLTLSTLGYSLRTVVIQPTALAYTMVESGVGRTMKAALDHAMFRENVPIEKSDFIANRTMDANIPALTEYILASPTGKVLQLPAKYAMEALKFVDAQAAKIAWRAAYSQYSHLGENMAIRMADRAVARTHGSGFAGDLSPIQMNALGKSLTLWQTFTINQLNWLAKDVLNLKHPERNPAQTVQKVMTYVVATELLGHLFEEGMGIEAPMPAPGHAIMESMKNNESGWETALNLLFETSEFMPMLSSGKFGSHWLGAPIDFIGKTSQTVQKDLQIVLDPSATDWAKDSARIRILTLLGRGLGVPGTGQVSKYVKARRRGEEGIYAVMGRYEEGKTGGRKSKSGKSKSRMKYTPARQ